jgi:hypothetical protein
MYRVTVNGVSSMTVTPLFELSPNVNDMAAVLQNISGCRVLMSEQIVTVPVPTLAPGNVTERITRAVTLPAGADFFDAVPLDGGRHLRPVNFAFGASDFSLYFYNDSTSTLTNGAYRFLVRYYKTI